MSVSDADLPIGSWRVTRAGLIVSSDRGSCVIPFAQFGGLVLALLRVMTNREGR